MAKDRTVKVWLAIDPNNGRVAVCAEEPSEHSFPRRGRRGAAIWPFRETNVNADDLARVLAGNIPGDEVDRLHRAWWDDARRPGEPLWEDENGD